MREIKFRGKRVDICTWVYGYLTNRPEYTSIAINQVDSGGGLQSFTVDQNTIGQFTGLHDSEGREIYEGDEEERGLIAFSDGCWKLIHNPECRSEMEGECRWDYLYDFKSEDLEVIGTIHDEEG